MKAHVVRDRCWRVGVVVPACDEAATIEACIDSIVHALDTSAAATSSWIVIVADSCRDDTAERARARLAARGEVLECAVGSAGAARGLGAERVIEHFGASMRSRLWIANTDADSTVNEDWVARQLAFAQDGFTAVAGIVHVESIESHRADIVRALMQDYAMYEDGTHPHVHGANLGIRADAYLDAGGWSALALAEDHCLWERVRARGWRVVSSIASVVITSGRLHGRAGGGFADTLRHKLEVLYA